jgi:hypothetical protein
MIDHTGTTFTLALDSGRQVDRHGARRRVPAMLPGGHLQTVFGGLIPVGYPRSLQKPIVTMVPVADGVNLGIETTENYEDSAIVVLVHGFTSHANSPVIRRAMQAAFERGYTVVRVKPSPLPSVVHPTQFPSRCGASAGRLNNSGPNSTHATTVRSKDELTVIALREQTSFFQSRRT